MADSTVASLAASDALAGTELFYADGLASAAAADVKVTATKIKTWTSASPTLVTPNLGTPSAGVLTNVTGTAAGLTAGNVTTNANLTGPITSVGNTTSIASQTGTGTKFVVDTSPTLVTPVIGVATGTSLALSGVALGTNVFAAAGTGLFNLNAAAAPAGATGTGVQLVGTDATVARFEADSFGAIGAFTVRRANGTGASPTALASSDQIGAFNFHGYYVTGGPGYSSVQASVGALATQNWTSTNQGTQILLRTTPNNSTTLTTALTIGQDQSVAMAGTSTIATSLAIGGATIGTNALAVTGTIGASAGTAAVPSINFGGSAGTGIYSPAAGYLAFTYAVSSPAFGIDNSGGEHALALYNGSPITFSAVVAGGSGADTHLSRNAAGVIQFGTTAANAAGAWLAAKGTLTGGTLADQAQVLAITATQPASPTATQEAIKWTITSAGSASQTNTALALDYNTGYTGSTKAMAIRAYNNTTSTGTGGWAGGNANYAAYLASINTTTGHQIATYSEAQNGNLNVGLLGLATTAKNSATNIGVVGQGLNTGTSPVQIGGFFALNQTTIPTVNAALIADNGSQTDAIALFRDNNTTKISVVDGGQMTFAAAVPLAFSSGTNQRAGNATLVGGTVTVSNATVTANTVVMLTRKTSGGTIGTAITYTLSAGASFTINSDNILDTSTFSYVLIEVP